MTNKKNKLPRYPGTEVDNHMTYFWVVMLVIFLGVISVAVYIDLHPQDPDCTVEQS